MEHLRLLFTLLLQHAGGATDALAATKSAVALILWVYYVAQIFLLGAEFTKVYANERGSVAGRKGIAATAHQKAIADAGFEPH